MGQSRLTKENWFGSGVPRNNGKMRFLKQRPSISVFIARLMHLGPLPGLIISKILAVMLVLIALRFRQPRVVVLANYWFAALVTWNLALIFSQAWRSVPV